jgi:hypothetical protein
MATHLAHIEGSWHPAVVGEQVANGVYLHQCYGGQVSTRSWFVPSYELAARVQCKPSDGDDDDDEVAGGAAAKRARTSLAETPPSPAVTFGASIYGGRPEAVGHSALQALVNAASQAAGSDAPGSSHGNHGGLPQFTAAGMAAVAAAAAAGAPSVSLPPGGVAGWYGRGHRRAGSHGSALSAHGPCADQTGGDDDAADNATEEGDDDDDDGGGGDDHYHDHDEDSVHAGGLLAPGYARDEFMRTTSFVRKL